MKTMKTPVFDADEPLSPTLGQNGAAGEERVGYGRPPRATRFRPGRSGNPSGVAKSQRISKLVARALEETVDLPDKSGAMRTLTKLELTVTQLVNRAATADRHATQLVFSLLREEQARPDPSQPRRLDENDDLVIADLVRTLSRPLQ